MKTKLAMVLGLLVLGTLTGCGEEDDKANTKVAVPPPPPGAPTESIDPIGSRAAPPPKSAVELLSKEGLLNNDVVAE